MQCRKVWQVGKKRVPILEPDEMEGREAGWNIGMSTCRLVRSQRLCSMPPIVPYSGLDRACWFALIFTHDNPRQLPPKQSPGLSHLTENTSKYP